MSKYEPWRRGRESWKAFVGNQGTRKRIGMIFLIFVVIVAAALGKSLMDDRKHYIVDKRGNVQGVLRESEDAGESIPLIIRYREHGKTIEREVVLNLPQIRGEDAEEEPYAEAQRDLVADLLEEVGRSKKQKILLPGELSDGTAVSWRKGGRGAYPLLLLMPFLLVLAMFLDEQKKKQAEVKEKEHDIKRNLPGFCTQLTMLLDCGLIVPDAIRRIADGYRNSSNPGFFQGLILETVRRSDSEERSMTSVLNEQAEALHVREWTRVVNLITENQTLGIDLRSKLRSEGEILWNQRKKLAEERGKLAETRMTMPLAMLLLVLIMVTAAPAVLHVKGV